MHHFWARSAAWIARHPPKVKVEGSNPSGPVRQTAGGFLLALPGKSELFVWQKVHRPPSV